jgi:hypothetical protein
VEEPFGFRLISRSLRSHPAEQAYDAITEEQGASSRLL